MSLQLTSARFDNLCMDGDHLAKLVAFRDQSLPEPRSGLGVVDGAAVGMRARLANYAIGPLDSGVGRVVFATGVVLCTTGTLLEPRSRPSVEFSWYAQLLGMLFWLGALIAAGGLVYRKRVALLGASLAAAAFAIAAMFVPSTTTSGFTTRWLMEVVCALAFVAVCVYSIVTTPKP